MTSLGVMQAAPVSACEQMAVAPRMRKHRGATKTKSPAALAAGNGHNRTTAAAVTQAASEALVPAKPVRKPRRRFQRLTIGFPVDVAEGHVERWGFVEEPPDRWGNVIRRRVRLLDEDGFPTTGLTGWIETDRWLSEPVVIKFEEDQSFPKEIRTASASERRRYPSECVGGFRLIYAKRPKPLAPKREWFPASDGKRKEFLASLPEAPPEVKAALVAPLPEPAPLPEQWFRVVLSQAMFDRGAWEEFPDGWCAKLVPQPEPDYGAIADPDWTYVQLPYHFDVWYEDEEGQLSSRRKTDKAGGGHVKCGMWIPRWLLEPISVGEAADIYDTLAAQAAAGANS